MSISCSITSPTIHPPCGHRALRVPASHRPLVGGGRVATGARRLPTRLANVVAQVAEILADLVPSVADVVLRVSAVHPAGGLLDVGLDIAVGALDFVHVHLLRVRQPDRLPCVSLLSRPSGSCPRPRVWSGPSTAWAPRC